MSRIGSPYVIMTAAALMWAGNAIAGRLAVGEVSPMAVTSLRWAVVVVLLGMLFWRRILAERRALGAHWLYILAMGGLGFTAFNALFYEAAQRTSAVNLGVIQGTMPAFMLVGSLLVYRTAIHPLQLIGLCLTLIGVGVTTSRGDLSALRGLDFNRGDVLMLAACVLYSGYAVAIRRRPPIPPIVFFAGLALAALLSSLPLLAWEVESGTVQWPTVTGWLILAFVAICPSLLAQLCLIRSVELIGPGRAGLFINLVPIFAALLAVALLGETFAPYHAIALALVLGGIWLSERGR